MRPCRAPVARRLAGKVGVVRGIGDAQIALETDPGGHGGGGVDQHSAAVLRDHSGDVEILADDITTATKAALSGPVEALAFPTPA